VVISTELTRPTTKRIRNVMYLCINKQLINFQNFFQPSSRKVVKRHFLIANVTAGNRTVRRGHVTRETRV
jgi:hypothetical protein